MYRRGWSDRGGQPAGNQQPSQTSEDHEMADDPSPPNDNNQWAVNDQGSQAPSGCHVNNSHYSANRMTHWPAFNGGSDVPDGYHVNTNGKSAGYLPAAPSYNTPESQDPYGSHVSNSGHLTNYPSAQQHHYSLSSYGSSVNNNHGHSVGHCQAPDYYNLVSKSTYSASHHPAEASYNSSGFDSSDSLYVNNGEDSASDLPTKTSYLAERRNQDPLSVIVETPSNPYNCSVTQEGNNYQPKNTLYSGKGESKAAYVADSYEPETVAYIGKGKGRATNVEDRPPTPPPKDPMVPVYYTGKGKGRAINAEDDTPDYPLKEATMKAPEDVEMEDEFSPNTYTSPTKCLISPMRKLMGAEAGQAPSLSCGSPTKAAIKRDIKGKRPRVFNLLESIFTQNDITLNVTRHMEVRDFLTLYCISKMFHWLVNSHMATYMMSMARVHAPLAMVVFPYTYRRSLCILDPVLRDHPTDPSKRGRVVPSPKWLQMLAFREAVSHDILLAMALEGHRFPHPIQEVLLKIWMLLDLPRTALRLGVIRNSKIWHNRDLFVALMFFMKLDMRLSDPVVGDGECLLSKLLLAQRSLEPLWEALRGWRLTTETELLAMVVEWDYAPRGFANPKHEAVFGVPAGKIGSLCCEDWTPSRPVLLRPDEVILGECIRRQLDLNRCFVDFMLWGYVNWRSGHEIPLPDNEELKRRFKDKLGYDDCLVEYRKALAEGVRLTKLREEQMRKEAEEKSQAEAAAGSGLLQQ